MPKFLKMEKKEERDEEGMIDLDHGPTHLHCSNCDSYKLLILWLHKKENELDIYTTCDLCGLYQWFVVPLKFQYDFITADSFQSKTGEDKRDGKTKL